MTIQVPHGIIGTHGTTADEMAKIQSQRIRTSGGARAFCQKQRALDWKILPKGFLEGAEGKSGRKMKTLEQRFWEKVDKDGPVPAHKPELGKCWIWTGVLAGGGDHARKGYGYGYLHIKKIGEKRRMVKANRIAYELNFGEFPNGKWVLHKCDNVSCVNPDHLFLGSPLDNCRDMISKKRHNFSGLGAFHKKLTEKEVSEIKSTKRYFGRIRDLMKKYAVSENTILRILNGTSWKHVNL